ncbi:polyprenyl synthetase family protein [Nocardia terpenica]|uniref:polyprenyl synthetase family protein n=1 Tax=Nocardia terpenica TaxID=455432 RepID=UPI002FE3387B
MSGRTAVQLLADARSVSLPVMRKAVDALPEPLRRMAGYHLGWWDAAGVSVAAVPGKSLRPALVVASAAAICGEVPASARSAAAAVELIHNFTLLHDDVMDGDRTRRGRETVWSVWGIPDAILLGDTLHTLAIELLTTDLPGQIAVTAVARLEDAVIELCRGQHEDCAFEVGGPVDIEEYLRMSRGKTGALMGAACALGALCAGASTATVTALETFGAQAGLAFQAIDDLLGIWGDPAVTGKPAGNDLARRKRSLPVVAALQEGGAAGRELAGLYCCDTPMSPAEVARAAVLVEAAGGRRWAQQYAEDRVQAAREALPARIAAEDLLMLADLVAHRDR